ncbi:hypothetical protein M431DRAFT_303233 [Trichoderma harzianum CBS 226.95]|uniref:Uncharacterized protein n=1 Tax=Trichoderma harzianum CBS 226.95 TaxID=983964 RepID=A0A2T4AQR2_TRIHA|nr:hypothetical protein M431DRAFT_303233 [Trichoderma harzianum CBS 226.95]PTB59407.1 hypothetical protein M431DRAFT_303233 [Trichoderma harzianum CBS 226.95]
MMKPVQRRPPKSKRNESLWLGLAGAREPPQRPETFDTKKIHKAQKAIETITTRKKSHVRVQVHSCATRVELEALKGNMIRRDAGMTIPGRLLVFGLGTGNRVRCNTDLTVWVLVDTTGAKEQQQLGSMACPVVASAGTQLGPIKHCRTCTSNRCCCRYEYTFVDRLRPGINPKGGQGDCPGHQHPDPWLGLDEMMAELLRRLG